MQSVPFGCKLPWRNPFEPPPPPMAVKIVLSKGELRLLPSTKQATMMITVKTITEHVAGMRMVRLCIELKPPPAIDEVELVAEVRVFEIVSNGGKVSIQQTSWLIRQINLSPQLLTILPPLGVSVANI